MNLKLRYFLYGALLSIVIYIYPAAAEYRCAKLKDALPIMLQSGYAFVATAEVSGGAGIMLFINQSGTFKLVGVDKELNACVLLTGVNWAWVIEGKA